MCQVDVIANSLVLYLPFCSTLNKNFFSLLFSLSSLSISFPNLTASHGVGVAQAKPACKHTIATRKCYQYNTIISGSRGVETLFSVYGTKSATAFLQTYNDNGLQISVYQIRHL